MPIPEIAGFGDDDHEVGEEDLVVSGGGFGAFPGSLYMYENDDRSGAVDQLTVTSWSDMELTGVVIPSSLNNTTGEVFLFLQREDLAWSLPYSFTLTQSSALESVDILTDVETEFILTDVREELGLVA